MPKPVKSQWDFGELFPMEPRRKVLSVSELTTQIKNLLETRIGEVWVSGEVTNLRLQTSGHMYFTLKDAGAQISAVLFRGERGVDRALVQDGRKLTVKGEVTVYEPRGQYQLRVTSVELQGIGALQAAFEKLKQKLNAEGLFAQERKRALPRFPQRIGLVTSPTGAAIRDVLHVVERRNPALEIILAPCRVQGEGAASEIAAGIRLLNEFNLTQTQRRDLPLRHDSGVEVELFSNLAPSQPLSETNSVNQPYLDLILVTRGGGSLEDLWAFNEEAVARAIFESSLPVVSAIGHEIDFTISDFVADHRAATPSAAAEIITEGVFASLQFVSVVADRMGQLVRQQFEDKLTQADQTSRRLARLHPRRRLNDNLQRLDDFQTSLTRCAAQGLRQHRVSWRGLSERLLRVRPAVLLKQRREVFRQAGQRLREQAHHHLRELKNRFAMLDARLRLLSPEQVLARGYSITRDAETGKVIRDAKETKAGQRIETKLKSGAVISKVEKPVLPDY